MQSEIANLIKEANGSSSGLQEKKYTTHYGVNRLADKLSQPDEYFYTLRNCYVSKQNLILQRNGYDSVTTSAVATSAELLTNTDFEAGDPPTGWTSGTGTFSSSTTYAHGGTKSYKIIQTSGAAVGHQHVSWSTYWRGKTVRATGWVRTATADVARINIYDGVGTTNSDYVVTAQLNGFVQLTVTRTISNSATELTFQCEVAGAGTAYFDDVSLVEVSTLTKIRKLFEYENAAGGRTIIGRGGSTWARLGATTWTILDSARASDAYGQICQFTYYGVMTDGGRARKFNSTWTVSDVDTTYAPEHSSCCHTHNHRLILNDDDNPLSFYIGKVDEIATDPFDTSTNDAAIINLANVVPVGDKIIGFSSYLSNYLIIWMRRHIVVYDLPTITANIKLQQVIRTGCLSYDGIIYTQSGDILYPNETGYKSFVQSFVTQSVLDIKDETALIGPYYRSVIPNLGDTRDICGVNYTTLDHSIFKLPMSSPELWIMSEDLKVATGGKGNIAGYYTEINPYSFLVDREDRLLFGGGDGILYQMDTGTNDLGSAIQIEIQKTGISFGNQSIYKKPKEFECVIESTKSATLNLKYDFGVFGSTASTEQLFAYVTGGGLWDVALWDVDLWNASGQNLLRSRNMLGRGKFMNLKLTHATLDAVVKIPYFILRYLNLGVD